MTAYLHQHFDDLYKSDFSVFLRKPDLARALVNSDIRQLGVIYKYTQNTEAYMGLTIYRLMYNEIHNISC